MSKFKIGDRVRVLNGEASGSCHVAGDLGTVISANHGIYKVRGDIERDSCRWWVAENDLEFALNTYSINIPESKEVSGVDTNEDHIRVNLKSKIQAGKWYQSTCGNWGKCVREVGGRFLLEPLGGNLMSCDKADLVEIEPFEEILQVLGPKDDSVTGDLYWNNYICEWLPLRGVIRVVGRAYARKRLVLKKEYGG